MKKQIILTIIIGIILACFIYKWTYHDEMSILSLGDGLSLGMTAYNVEGYSFNDYLRDYYEENSILREYIKEFSMVDETPSTLLKKINNNESLESTNLTIQQALTNAKIITISLGMDQLNNKKTIKSKDITEYLETMQNLIKRIKAFNKKEVFVIGLYSTPKLNPKQIATMNETLRKIAQDNQCTFIDISTISDNNEYFFHSKSYYPNYKAHKYISELLINKLS